MKSTGYVEIGNRIRSLRLARGLTIRQLAAAAGGYDPGNLSRIERGIQAFSTDSLQSIANALRVPVSVLLGSVSDVPAAITGDNLRMFLSESSTTGQFLRPGRRA